MKNLFKKGPSFSDFTYRTDKEEPLALQSHVGGLLASGLYFALSGAYRSCIPVARPYAHIITALGMIVCAALTLYDVYKNVPRFVKLLPPITAGVLFLALNPVKIYGGLLGIINYHIEEWNYKYDDGKALFDEALVSKNGEISLSIIVALLTISCVYYLISKKSSYGILVIIAISFLPSLILGRFNSIAFSVALAILFLSIMQRMQSGDIIRRIVWALVIFAATLLLTLTVTSSNTRIIDSFKENQKNMVNTIRFGTDSLPQGDLKKCAELTNGDEERLKVSCDYGRDLYLKGFVGADLVGNEWQSLKNSDYGSGKSSVITWLQGEGFTPQFQYNNYIQNSSQRYEINLVEVENVGARRNYVYTPYSTMNFNTPTIYKHNDDNLKSSALFGAHTYKFSEQSERRPTELFTLEKWYINPTEPSQEDYVKNEKVYRKFVYNTYLDVNDEHKAILNKLFWDEAKPEEKDNLFSAIEYIRDSMEERYYYTEHPKYVEKSDDAVKDFLTHYGRGNSALYTSVAVEALRLAGYPARYVEGYYLENGDELQAQVTLTTKNAHTWAEVYMDGIGWLPIEFTPGFYYEVYSLISFVDTPQSSQTVKDNGVNKSGDKVKLSVEGGEGSKRTPKQRKRDMYIVIGVFVGVFVFCGIILIVAYIVRFLRVLQLRHLVEKAPEYQQQEYICKLISAILEYDGIDASLGRNPKQAETQILLKHSEFYDGDYVRVHGIMEKLRYGELMLEDYEKQILVQFLEKYVANIHKSPAARMRIVSKLKIQP